jgi:putative thioredoxin
MVFDAFESDFEQRVLARSRELPVVVDFWAGWCAPCRALTPALEAAAAAREGEVELAKVDVDRNQALAARFRVQGIPAVKAFRDGRVVDEFTGALPPAQVEAFFDSLVPSEADRLSGTDDEDSLRRALELDPRHTDAARKLGRMLVRSGDNASATELLAPFEHDYVAAGLLARARLAASDGLLRGDGGDPAAGAPDGRLGEAFRAWDEGDQGRALERLQEAITAAPPEQRDLLRQVMVAIFTELGPDHALAREHRRRLAAALN